MKRLLASLVMVLALGCGPRTQGSGVSKTETRTVAAFSEVAASSGLDVQVHTGGARSVTVTGDDNIVPLVETEVSGDRLRVAYKSGTNVSPKTLVHVVVTLPTLRALSVSSGCHLQADGIRGDALDVHASSGVSATLSGTTGALTLDATSGVGVDAHDLAAKTVSVHASSGASVTVRAAESVSGDASSGSSLKVAGNPPKRAVTTSSGASVSYE